MRSFSIVFIVFILLLLCSACEKYPVNSNPYPTGVIPDTVDSNNYMRFERQGGGQIDFKLYLTNNTDNIKGIITKYNFRDTSIETIIVRNISNDSTFNNLKNALNNQFELKGDYEQPSLTGTWAYVYIILEGIETEVTNTSLRNSLIQFEKIINEKIE
ncbi:hypothetical protein ACE1ET_01155 [Saccharicrinis sp. FJH62]|uniref:hypothetical protein n=1 Tax=Saccharicrinis sp. FJH62 TaxID=3344657 RepID=UPI0035D44329